MTQLDRIKVTEQTAELFAQISQEAQRDQDLYSCLICRDTGWMVTEQGAQPCSCGQQDASRQRRRAVGLGLAMDGMRFANFDLTHYTVARKLPNGLNYRQAADQALRAAKGFVAAVVHGERPRGLYFEGPLGTGKTFLAAAIANELVERGLDVRFVVVPEFLEQLRLSYRNQQESEKEYDEAQIMNRALNARVLVLDDLGAHNSSQWTISKLYTLLNHRLNNQLPCVITSNLQPKAVAEELGPRTASRLQEMCDRYLLLTDEDIRAKKNGRGIGW